MWNFSVKGIQSEYVTKRERDGVLVKGPVQDYTGCCMKKSLWKMELFYPKSLQQRTIIFVLLPIFFFLTLAGFFGYRAVRSILLEQWSEAALAKLERSAFDIDVQLERPKEVLLLLEGITEKVLSEGLEEMVIDQLERVDGVVSVKVEWVSSMARDELRFKGRSRGWFGRRENSRWIFDITPPVYNVENNSQTVSMVTDLVNKNGFKVGDIEVVLDFEKLISRTVKKPWWNVNKAYIIDYNGVILNSTDPRGEDAGQKRKVFGENGILEQKTLEALREEVSGTVFGPGRPPEEISGFYHLQEAPWVMVVIAPGKKVLKPIIRFRLLFFYSAMGCIAILLLFIRIMIAKTTRAINELSRTASDLARGVFDEPLPVNTRDEVGLLTENFNTMTSQLKKGVQLQKAMDIAREVQMTLLPRKDFSGRGVEISGLSTYCDETGGDYFDFIERKPQSGRFHVIVGDVVGHGIGAALLMATLRALVRANVYTGAAPDMLVSNVNRQLCLDTAEHGNFASLFYLHVDVAKKRLQWVRAGHDPAILFNTVTNTFSELKGNGLVLGLDPEYQFQTNSIEFGSERLVVLMGSDGVWEAVNEDGEQYGKQRLKQLVQENADLSPREMLHVINESISKFRGTAALCDDITLVSLVLDERNSAENRL